MTAQFGRDTGPVDEVVFETAAEHVCRRVPVATTSTPAGELRERLSEQRYESAIDVAVCEAEHLVGIARIEDVLAAPAAASIGELMDPDPPVVGPETDQELAASRAVDHVSAAWPSSTKPGNL